MKQAILTILSALMTSLKAESRRFHGMIIGLIRSSIEPGSESQVYLLDEALELWEAVIEQTMAPASSELLSLVPYILPIFELGTENLRKAFDITECYFLLAPSEMLDDSIRNSMLSGFASLLGTLKRDYESAVTNLIELLIRAADDLGGEDATKIIAGSLVDTDLLSKILSGLRESFEAHQTTGPNRKNTSIDGVVETDYFSVFARIVLASPSVFVSAIEVIGAQRSERFEQTIEWVLTEWFSHFENIGEPAKKKLMCLALTRMLETGQEWILQRLQELMTLWTDIVTELGDGAEEKGGE